MRNVKSLFSKLLPNVVARIVVLVISVSALVTTIAFPIILKSNHTVTSTPTLEAEEAPNPAEPIVTSDESSSGESTEATESEPKPIVYETPIVELISESIPEPQPISEPQPIIEEPPKDPLFSDYGGGKNSCGVPLPFVKHVLDEGLTTKPELQSKQYSYPVALLSGMVDPFGYNGGMEYSIMAWRIYADFGYAMCAQDGWWPGFIDYVSRHIWLIGNARQLGVETGDEPRLGALVFPFRLIVDQTDDGGYILFSPQIIDDYVGVLFIESPEYLRERGPHIYFGGQDE